MNGKLKTIAEVRQDFSRKGASFADWATTHGIRPLAVYDLINGRTRGIRGDAHKAAVLLGLKEGEIVDSTKTDGRNS